MQSNWERVRSNWPPSGRAHNRGLDEIKEQAYEFLAENNIHPLAFSHFGIALWDTADSLATLRELLGWEWQPTTRSFIESSGVHVTRGDFEGAELELIQPEKPGFLLDALRQHGEHLNHISYEIADITDCHDTLTANGIPSLFGIRQGSHGEVAFFAPKVLEPLYLELWAEPDA